MFERTEKKKKNEHASHSRLYYTREGVMVGSSILTNDVTRGETIYLLIIDHHFFFWVIFD